MLRALLSAYRGVLGASRGRAAVAALVALAAALPVLELTATYQFSALSLQALTRPPTSPSEIVAPIVLVVAVVGFAGAGHHALRLVRERVFRNAIADPSTTVPTGWGTSHACELGVLLVALVQLTFVVLVLTVVDLVIGLVCLLVALVVLATVDRSHARLLARPVSDAPEARRRRRILGTDPSSAVEMVGGVAIAPVLVVLVVLLARAATGGVVPAAAITLFLGLRMFSRHLAVTATHAVRLARSGAVVEAA